MFYQADGHAYRPLVFCHMDLSIRRTAFVAFMVTLAVIICVESLITGVHSLRSTTYSLLGSILPWFAGLEAICAVMLMFPRTRKIGGWMLLLIFVSALIVHGPVDHLYLFVYTAGVILIMHGRVAAPQANEKIESKADTDD